MSNEAVIISLDKYITTVNAKIGDHVYKVRKMGAGDALDLSALASEAEQAQVNVLNLRGKYESAKDDDKKLEILHEIGEAMKPLSNIQNRMMNIYCSLFDDGDDGHYTKNLINALGIEQAQKVYNEIMGKANGKDEKESA